MVETGRDAIEWSIPEDVPEGRCGFTVKYESMFLPGAVTCWRPSWRDHDRCIWHADIADKPVDELADARSDVWERLDGAVLRNTDLECTVGFNNCFLLGSDFSHSDLRRVKFRNARLHHAILTESTFFMADLSGATLSLSDVSGAHLKETDLSSALLVEVSLTGAYLAGANLSNAKLKGADLSDSVLDHANAPDADLENADLTDADFQYTDFTDANLENTVCTRADFCGAALNSVTFQNAELRDANLRDADLTNVVGREADFSDTNLQRAHLIEGDLQNTDFRGADFRGADLSEADLVSAVLAETHFGNATLSGADLGGADLTGAQFWGDDLTNANLPGVNLTDASLAETNLTNADLENAVLHNTSMQYAQLKNAILERADLTRTDLFNTNLTGTSLYGAIIESVQLNSGTKFGGHYAKGDIEKAAWTLSQIEELSRQNALPDQVRESFTTRKDRRRQHYWHNSTIPDWIRRPVRRLKTAGNGAITRLYDGLRNWINDSTETVSESEDTSADSGDDSNVGSAETPDEPTDDTAEESTTTSSNSDGLTNWQRWVNTSKWAWLALTGASTRYGESPRRVMRTSLVIILVFTALYPLLGGVAVESADTSLTVFDPLDTPLDELPGGTWLASLYFSVVTFTTLGYGDIQPASAPAQFLAGIESLLGAVLMALLVAVLARRITR